MEKSNTESAVNNVDTSPEKVNQEWGEIAADEKIEDIGGDDSSGQAEPVPEQADPDKEKVTEKLAGFLRKLFKWSFNRFTPGWHITEDESGSLGDAWSAVIIKYLPGRWLQFVPGGGALIEIDAVMITVDIVEPRLKIKKNSETDRNGVSGQPAPPVDLGKKPVSEHSRKHSEKNSEKQADVMPEVHEIEADK